MREWIRPSKFQLLHVLPATDIETHGTTGDICQGTFEREWIWSNFSPQRPVYDASFYDASWTYIYDLDRDAFTVNSTLHFRLSNIPVDWTSHVNPGRHALQCMPTSLDAAHLSWDVFPTPLNADQDLLLSYEGLDAKVVDPPTPSKHLNNWIMLELQLELRKYGRSTEFKEQWKEWTPLDRRMQQWVYATVKCAMWDGLRFEYSAPRPRGVWRVEEGLNFLLDTAITPEEPAYFIPVRSEKVLISLEIQLDVGDIAKMAIAKVVKLVPDGTHQTACIISPGEVIIVNIDKLHGACFVTHTEPLQFDDINHIAFDALIATLSPPDLRLDRTPSNGNLPVEIVEQIFEALVFDGGFKTLPSLACTCKMFSTMVHDRTLYLPGRLFYNYPIAMKEFPNVYFGWDVEDGNFEFYSIGTTRVIVKDKLIKYKVFADGANIGLGKFGLAPLHWYGMFQAVADGLRRRNFDR